MQVIKPSNLEAFLTVAEAGSFRSAGNILGLGQSAVSRRIQQLEDYLGVSLFERRPSGARLTQAGKRFAAHARTVMTDVEIAVQSARSAGTGANGQLHIGTIASLSQSTLRELLGRFFAAHEDVEVKISQFARSELLSFLNHRQIDAIIDVGNPEPELGDGLAIAEETVLLAIPADHPLSDKEQIDWDDLANFPLLTSTCAPGFEMHEHVRRHSSGFRRDTAIQHHRLDRDGLMTLVGLRQGVCLVTDQMNDARYENVRFVPLGSGAETVPFSLYWRP
ncbi:MAG: LysR family transcriptional regulator [Myxococcota bacterium]